MRKRTVLAILPLLLLCGCVSWIVPKTVISGSIGGQPFRYSGPKDQTLGSLVVTANTNGAVSIRVSNLATKMNPDIISMSGKAQVDIINAISDAVAKAAASAPK